MFSTNKGNGNFGNTKYTNLACNFLEFLLKLRENRGMFDSLNSGKLKKKEKKKKKKKEAGVTASMI